MHSINPIEQIKCSGFREFDDHAQNYPTNEEHDANTNPLHFIIYSCKGLFIYFKVLVTEKEMRQRDLLFPGSFPNGHDSQGHRPLSSRHMSRKLKQKQSSQDANWCFQSACWYYKWQCNCCATMPALNANLSNCKAYAFSPVNAAFPNSVSVESYSLICSTVWQFSNN